MKNSTPSRKRRGDGSLFQSGGYWFYTYGYSVDGEQGSTAPTGEANKLKAD
jgi:hypothetical protein